MSSCLTGFLQISVMRICYDALRIPKRGWKKEMQPVTLAKWRIATARHQERRELGDSCRLRRPLGDLPSTRGWMVAFFGTRRAVLFRQTRHLFSGNTAGRQGSWVDRPATAPVEIAGCYGNPHHFGLLIDSVSTPPAKRPSPRRETQI